MLTRDDLLLRRARGGDRDALTELLKAHGPAIAAAISRRIDRPWQSVLDAEDVMQVTYIEAFLDIRSFDPQRASFGTWLQRMAENNLRDAIKGLSAAKRPSPAKRATEGDQQQSYVDLLDMLTADGGTPSRQAAAAEAKQFLETAIERLPPDYREVIRQYDIAGEAIGSVAEKMKRSEGAVFMIRARAHDRLRQLMPSVSALFSVGG